MSYVLGSRAAMGYVLGRGAGAAAAQWWLSGGVSAANAIAVYQPIGAASLAASYVNLANPGTYNAAPGTAPTFDTATGWTFSSPSFQYLTTGLATTGAAWSAIIRFSDVINPTAGPYLFGHSGFGIRPAGPSTNHLFVNAAALTVAGNVLSGVLAMSDHGYLNGSDQGALTGTAAKANSVIIGGVNTGSPGFYIAAKIQAFAIYNTTLTAPQVAALSAAIAAL